MPSASRTPDRSGCHLGMASAPDIGSSAGPGWGYRHNGRRWGDGRVRGKPPPRAQARWHEAPCGGHGAGTLLGVVGLQQQTPLVRPEPIERADDVLKVHMSVFF